MLSHTCHPSTWDRVRRTLKIKVIFSYTGRGRPSGDPPDSVSKEKVSSFKAKLRWPERLLSIEGVN